MDLHKFIGETCKVNEDELYDDERNVGSAPEVNDELIQGLENELPELKDVDQEELKKGLGIEMEHFNTVGGDVNIVARITLDHLNEFPGQKYYTALEQLESELSKAEEQVNPMEQDGIATEEPAPEVETETPISEPMTPNESKEKVPDGKPIVKG